ncbi:MAG TPA: hypothetical protein PKB02_10765 [Anaerohalosphaeraceae bacterium]|nr:hypothetical protein [Anaerohalosphaeraceae bacterium]
MNNTQRQPNIRKRSNLLAAGSRPLEAISQNKAILNLCNLRNLWLRRLAGTTKSCYLTQLADKRPHNMLIVLEISRFGAAKYSGFNHVLLLLAE